MSVNVESKNLDKYLGQDIDNPKYLFHGSPKKLSKLVPILSHDSDDNINNIACAIFLFPSFLKSTPYAFKDTIKKYSEGLNWDFDIPNGDEYPLMKMSNVNIDEDIIGYIYVFYNNSDMIKDDNSYQYKCYKELIPIDVIEVCYKDYMKYYEVVNKVRDFMHIPKIIFREMTLEENIDTIKWAYYENNGSLSVHDFTIGYFPELAVFDENTPKEIVYKKIEEVVTKEYNFYLEKIKSETKRYNDIWKKYNDKYLSLLSDYLEANLPQIDVIQGKVGLIPVFPRYLDEYSFSVSTALDDWFLIKSCAHETLHFMWFLKWKQIHPEIPRREYDSPYISWKYSEMVTDPVLNNKPFSNMFKDIFTERGYDSFYELKDKDNFVMDILRNIYSEDISIEEKINKGFNYIKRVLKDTETYIINAPESLKYITDNLDNILNKKIEQYKKIFQIENLEPIKINFFDDKQKFREFIYEIRGERESLPEYAVATFDNDMINAYIEKDIPKDSRKYKKTLFMATHELFHILYKNNILKNDYSKRIVWYDEGMAQFLSGEKDELFDEDNFRNFYLKVKEKTQIIPNLNELKHGITFNNNQYNGYDLSYLSIKYLNEILNEEDFIKLMGNFDKIKEYGNSIINDMFLYYDNIMEKTQRK